jgi:hypothetical protein
MADLRVENEQGGLMLSAAPSLVRVFGSLRKKNTNAGTSLSTKVWTRETYPVLPATSSSYFSPPSVPANKRLKTRGRGHASAGGGVARWAGP